MKEYILLEDEFKYGLQVQINSHAEDGFRLVNISVAKEFGGKIWVAAMEKEINNE